MLVLREMYRPFATKMDRQQWCSRVIHVVRHPDLLSYSEPHWLLVLYQFWHGDYTMSRNLLRAFSAFTSFEQRTSLRLARSRHKRSTTRPATIRCFSATRAPMCFHIEAKLCRPGFVQPGLPWWDHVYRHIFCNSKSSDGRWPDAKRTATRAIHPWLSEDQ